MNLKNRTLAFAKRMLAPALYFILLGYMSKQFTELLFFKSPSNELNTLGVFICNIPPSVPWVLLAVGGLWYIATFFGKGLQLRSPLFIVGASYLIFYFFGNIYNCAPLVWLSVVLIVPYILQHLLAKACNSWIEKCSRWLEDKLKEKEPQKKDDKWLWQYDSVKDGDPNSLAAGRKEIIELICEEVKKMSDDRHSFTIGLEGGWGTGKSTLLEHIKKSLKGKDSNGLTVECIDFSPWAYPEGQNLSIEFLHELRRALTKHSFRVRFLVNSYINALTSGYSLGPLRMLLGILFPKESLSRVKQKLNELILFHNLKLVVFIDDLDRLDETEIAEVFKMLRNTGDIANTVYLVAYDRPNVERFEKFCKGFLDKIINVEIDLSPYDGAILFEKFIRDIRGEFKKPLFSEDNNFDNILSIEQRPHIIREISNYRDIKRLTNSVKTRIKLLEKINSKLEKDESIGITKLLSINKCFLIFIEIVKMKDYNLYLDIKNQYIYEDEFSEELRKGFIETKINKHGITTQKKYKNRYKEIIIKYLVNNSTDHTLSEEKNHITRVDLHDYFASNSQELYVSTLIRTHLEESIKPYNSMLGWLEEWKKKEELIYRVVLQTRLSLEMAKETGKSKNFCSFIACLVTIEEYYTPLEETIKDFFYKNGDEGMINFIYHKRKEVNYDNNLELKNSYDRFFNSIVSEYYNKESKPYWYNIVIESQEYRIKELVNNGHFRRASEIQCWIGNTENGNPKLSDRTIENIRTEAEKDPEKFLTEWTFCIEDRKTMETKLWHEIESLFKTANDLKCFIDEANNKKPSEVLSSMLTLINETYSPTPNEKEYPRLTFSLNFLVFDAITKQDTTSQPKTTSL